MSSADGHASLPRRSLRATVIANYAGKLWTSLANLAFIPVYISFLGLENWGLIGLFASLQAWLALLDLGLSTTVNRLLAQGADHQLVSDRTRSLIRTCERLYWVMGVAAGILIALAAPFIADWLDARSLSRGTIIRAVLLMAGILIVQWPGTLYAGGLAGLDRQVALNVVRIAITTGQVAGGVAVLAWGSPTIEAFLGWQCVVQMCSTAILRHLLWRAMPGPRPACLSWQAWMHERTFAGGMLGITILGTVLTQFDKVVLSRMLPLDEFGRYTLAVTASNALALLSAPLAASVFPTFSRLAKEPDNPELRDVYHRTCQAVSVATIPIAMLLACFPQQVLTLWLGPSHSDPGTASLLALLSVGSACNSVMIMPFMLQLAHGWTSLSLRKNIVAVAIWVPLMLILVNRLGAQGAAIAWIALNVGYLVIEIPIMHARLLRSDLSRWYLKDVAPAVLVSLAVMGAGQAVLPSATERMPMGLFLAGVLAIALLGSLATVPSLRTRLLRRMSTRA